MQKVKINATAIGRKDPIVLPVDVKNVKKSLQFQSEMYEIGKKVEKYYKEGGQDLPMTDFLVDNNDVMLQELDKVIDFLTDMLDLTEEDVDYINGVDISEVYALSEQVNGKLINPSGEEVEEGGTPSRPDQSISEH
ncbi:MAG: hypothetical protein [Caudoviricetes sp.]|nr:MAG: hypothetical protein [Caudoviricetes sp.]